MKRSLARQMFLILLIPVLTGTSGCSFLRDKEDSANAPVLEATSDPEEASYKTTVVQRGDMEEKTVINFVMASLKKENLFFGISNIKLKKIYVEENSHVQKGQLIAELEMDDLDEKLEEYESEIETKELEYHHEKKLLKIKEEKEMLLKKTELKVFQQEIEDCKDSVHSLETELTLLKNNKKKNQKAKQKRCIYAPFDGVLKNIQNIMEEPVSDEKKCFAEIFDDKMIFQNTSNKNYGFQEGQTEDVYINNLAYKAKIVSCKKKEETYITTMKIESDKNFSDGTMATIYQKGTEFRDSLYVMANAVFNIDGEKVVYTLDKFGLKQITKVQTGQTVKNYTEIKSGVKEGDQIVLE